MGAERVQNPMGQISLEFMAWSDSLWFNDLPRRPHVAEVLPSKHTGAGVLGSSTQVCLEGKGGYLALCWWEKN